jgi:glycine/D-amino acid oxidase-like deaminating enzyme
VELDGEGLNVGSPVVSTTSLWLKEPHDGLPPSRSEGRAEVVVIGGGVTGCSCALTLAELGVRVRLYEAREIAGGASGRNGGFALRGAAVPYDEARRDLGDHRARQLMELTERSLDRMEELAGDAFRRVGSLRLAFDRDESDALRNEYDALREHGFAVEWVDELESPLDGLYLGAILHPGDGSLQPARWVRRLAAHAVRAGAEIREGEQVTIEELDADAVVVACDGFIPQLLPELPVHATRGQVLATEPLHERRYDRPHYARGGYDYWQQLPDGRLVIGGNRDASLDTEETELEETTSLIQDRIEVLVGQLVGHRPEVTDRWAGIWGTTPDRMPLVGEVRDKVWVAGGYSGHGNALGLACGDLVARAIVGEASPELELFDPARRFLPAG